MLKNTTTAASWLMYDNKRLGYNVDNNQLEVGDEAAQDTGTFIDFLSNGFKLRQSSAWMNANNTTFIYMAFAETPAKYSNAR